jgi:putative mRNA 3-end processing factor
MNGVRISLHPAGHIVGSAQVRLEYGGEVWVVSGDYKLEPDGLSQPFEPVRCHTFITESTFGLPIYQWPPQEQVFEEINGWWRHNQANGKLTLMLGYSLGKAQRLLQNLDHNIGKVFVHETIWNVNEAIRQDGTPLPAAIKVDRTLTKGQCTDGLLIAPMSVVRSDWAAKLHPFVSGAASGWMALRKMLKSRSTDYGFVLSDHADWPGLNAAVEATGAGRIIVTHGYQATFTRFLNEQGYEAYEANQFFQTSFSQDAPEGED